MEAGFVFGKNEVKIVHFSYYADDAIAGNPYNTAFQVHVVSDGFSGMGEWECDIKDFRQFVKSLEEMAQFQVWQADFTDIGYGSRLRFALTRTGHIQVSGLLYGAAAIQRLQFEFSGDQTALSPFIKGLKALLQGKT